MEGGHAASSLASTAANNKSGMIRDDSESVGSAIGSSEAEKALRRSTPHTEKTSPASTGTPPPQPPVRSNIYWLETAVCVLIALYSVYTMLRIAYRVSVRHAAELAPWLRPSWPLMPQSTGIDAADLQWRELVDFFPLLGPAFGVYILISRFVRAYASPRMHLWFYAVAGVGFVFYLHGRRACFMLALLAVNYAIARLHRVLPYAAYMLLVWTSQIGVLFINDRNDGYRFAQIHARLAFLDDSTGLVRWNILFNMSTLRMISFNYDLWESWKYGQERKQALAVKHSETCVDCAMRDGPCYKLRTDGAAPLESFDLLHYTAYLLYIPLYIGGPMGSFNSFVSYLHAPQRWFGFKQALVYGARIVMLFFVLSFMMHINHLNALRRLPHLFDQMSVAEKGSVMYLTLAFLWLKFSVIWKLFRLFALLDGVEVPEDMLRCFSDTVSVAEFWRSWHASFNQWILRYMYVPLGGSRYRLLVIFPIFGFIALWHDIEMHLFAWALVMCVAMIPEMAVQTIVGGRRFDWLRRKPYWRHLQALGSVAAIAVLILANLYGFGTGTSNTSKGYAAILSNREGQGVLLFVIAFFYTAGHVGRLSRENDAYRTQLLRHQCGLPLGSSKGA